MFRTGQTCDQTGLYRYQCCRRWTWLLLKGDRFPTCPGCGRAVQWTAERTSQAAPAQ